MKQLIRFGMILLVILVGVACQQRLNLTPEEVDGWITKLENCPTVSEQKTLCIKFKNSNIEVSPTNLQRINSVCSRTEIGVSVIKSEVKR